MLLVGMFLKEEFLDFSLFSRFLLKNPDPSLIPC